MKCRLPPILLFAALLLPGCVNVKVQPIHVTVDVNVKVDRALDNFFDDLDKQSATLNAPKS